MYAIRQPPRERQQASRFLTREEKLAFVDSLLKSKKIAHVGVTCDPEFGAEHSWIHAAPVCRDHAAGGEQQPMKKHRKARGYWKR
jgi:3'-phosphoadenosine 5'-phosphosulfate (PAPS) 3'-phosphatase